MESISHKGVFLLKRKNIVISSFVLAGFLVLGGFVIQKESESRYYQRLVANSYQRAFISMATEIGEMDASLQKCIYSGTPSMIAGICTEVYGKAVSAKNALSEMPFSSNEFENMQSFISKVGDYVFVLSKKAGAGGEISEDEYNSLKSLSEISTLLSGNLMQLMSQVAGGEISLSDISRSKKEAAKLGEETADSMLGGQLKIVESEFPEIPSLLYDGPFSSHIAGLKPKMLEGQEKVDQEEAKSIAADFLEIEQEELEYGGERAGSLPAHMFTANFDGAEVNIDVTKQGGVVCNMFSSRSSAEEIIPREDAVKLAARFLEKKGYPDMKESYYAVSNNIVTINFTYLEGDVKCYPDMIKISVALDKGNIVGFESQGFVMNHVKREIPDAQISEEEAAEKVSKKLKITDHAMAIIPTMGKNEEHCHEFKCETDSGQKYVVYIDAETGRESRIFMLQETDNGTLAM